MPSADWYFDFVSPFSYLQCEQLPSLERSLRVRYRPVLFAGLLKAYEHKGPAEIPAKRRFTYRFVVWQAKRLGIPLKFPAAHPFNPLPLLRLAIVADCDPDASAICQSNGRSSRPSWASPTRRIGSPRPKSRTRSGATPTRRSRAACSVCPRSPSAKSCSGARTRRRWRRISSHAVAILTIRRWIAWARFPLPRRAQS